MLHRLIQSTALLALLTLPGAGFAAGGNDTAKPEQTETTRDCFRARQWDPETEEFVRFDRRVNGVWNPEIKKCVRPDKLSGMDPEALYRAIRELAYAGRFREAITVLDQLPEQISDLALTYRGFTARKLGQTEQADNYYLQAIALNPDNFLARSYMGQGKVEAGDRVAAILQLREIQARGGAGTWAETSLRAAIETGVTYSH